MTSLAAELSPPWPPAAPATLAPCVLLALLLHLLLVLLMGNAPAGTAQRGAGVWGAVNVTLRVQPEGTEAQGAAAPWPEQAGLQGTAPVPPPTLRGIDLPAAPGPPHLPPRPARRYG